jgi:aerobic carbon-monoxide dehydrogenase large subunit
LVITTGRRAPADWVRFVGELVAMVVAETPAVARDGAERLVVDWAPLPAATASITARQGT